eukprot:6368420-Lingulodinium_polyedra.AAC.1
MLFARIKRGAYCVGLARGLAVAGPGALATPNKRTRLAAFRQGPLPEDQARPRRVVARGTARLNCTN